MKKSTTTSKEKKATIKYEKPKITVQVMSMKALLGENGWSREDNSYLAVIRRISAI